MSLDDSLAEPASGLVRALLAKGRTVATAESCTGGWIAKALTDVPGSSGCFGYGIVSYSNAAKTSLLGVTAGTLDREGAVSEATVRAMARGVLDLSGADLAVAVAARDPSSHRPHRSWGRRATWGGAGSRTFDACVVR